MGGGAELVVLELHQMFPSAPIYTSYATDEWRARLDNKVTTGWLQNWPFSKLRKFIPVLRIMWFSSLRLNKYDLVISSSGAEAKGIRVNRRPDKWQMINDKLNRRQTIHVNYCHAPTHYYWSRYDEYLKSPGFGKFDTLARLALKVLVSPLRKWDFAAAQRPNHIIANSTHTQMQIHRYYQRDSIVIHPPINIPHFGKWKMINDKLPARHGFIITGRQTPYKRIDLAVAACTELKLPLTVVGTGPDHDKLKQMAGPTVTFMGFVEHQELPGLLASAEAFLFPGLDDFGIAPVEALAAGTPVIAYHAGGALDYVTPTTGLFFEHQTVASLKAALKEFKTKKYNSRDIKQAAQSFSSDVFQKSLHTFLQDVLK